MSLHLAPFNPDREFVTQAPFRANGRAWGRGYLFDKSSIDIRTLRLLYEQRKLIYDDHPRAIKLLSKNYGGPKESKRDEPRAPKGATTGVDGGTPSQPYDEDAEIKKLMARYNKPDLFKMASTVPGAKMSMSKEDLARTLVRSGHGAA